MKFNRILEKYIKENEALVRVALKVDPQMVPDRDYREYDGYEGYILKEDNNYASVLFENMDIPIASVPFSIIKVIDVPNDTIEQIKIIAIEYLEKRRDLTLEIVEKIKACTSIDFLEQYLREEGLDDSDIKDIYKRAINCESFASTAGKIALGAGKFALNPDQAVYDWARSGISKIGKKLGINNQQGDNQSDNQVPKEFTIIDRYKPIIELDRTGDANQIQNLQTVLNSNFFASYSNNTGYYYYNKITGDLIKLSNDVLTGQNLEICLFNLKSKQAPTNINQIINYINTVLPNEILGGNITVFKKSFFNLS